MVCRDERAYALVDTIDEAVEDRITWMYTAYMRGRMRVHEFLRRLRGLLAGIRRELALCGYYREAREIDKALDLLAVLGRMDGRIIGDGTVYEVVVLVDKILAYCRDSIERTAGVKKQWR